jgi:hypothetical protein
MVILSERRICIVILSERRIRGQMLGCALHDSTDHSADTVTFAAPRLSANSPAKSLIRK